MTGLLTGGKGAGMIGTGYSTLGAEMATSPVGRALEHDRCLGERGPLP